MSPPSTVPAGAPPSQTVPPDGAPPGASAVPPSFMASWARRWALAVSVLMLAWTGLAWQVQVWRFEGQAGRLVSADPELERLVPATELGQTVGDAGVITEAARRASAQVDH